MFLLVFVGLVDLILGENDDLAVWAHLRTPTTVQRSVVMGGISKVGGAGGSAQAKHC